MWRTVTVAGWLVPSSRFDRKWETAALGLMPGSTKANETRHMVTAKGLRGCQTAHTDSSMGSTTQPTDPTSQGTHYVSTTQPSWLMLCKIWGFHGCYYQECHFVGYKNPVPTSQEKHYVSATQSSQLMLCKVWGFQGCDYQECHFVGYKNPVRTSQETHYVSTTQPSGLMLCKVWGFHGCDYQECRLVGYKNPVRTSQETHYISAK
jgi:hypothetical protein